MEYNSHILIWALIHIYISYDGTVFMNPNVLMETQDMNVANWDEMQLCYCNNLKTREE